MKVTALSRHADHTAVRSDGYVRIAEMHRHVLALGSGAEPVVIVRHVIEDVGEFDTQAVQALEDAQVVHVAFVLDSGVAALPFLHVLEQELAVSITLGRESLLAAVKLGTESS